MLKISVQVHPQAKKNLVKKVSDNQQDVYHVYLTESPIKGQANQALIKILAEYFKCKSSQVFITKGETSKKKLVEIY